MPITRHFPVNVSVEVAACGTRPARLRRIARPDSNQAEIMTGLGLKLEDRIDADPGVTPREFAGETLSAADGLFESPL